MIEEVSGGKGTDDWICSREAEVEVEEVEGEDAWHRLNTCQEVPFFAPIGNQVLLC